MEEEVDLITLISASELIMEEPSATQARKKVDGHGFLAKIVTVTSMTRSILTYVLVKVWKTLGTWTVTEMKPRVFKFTFNCKRTEMPFWAMLRGQ